MKSSSYKDDSPQYKEIVETYKYELERSKDLNNHLEELEERLNEINSLLKQEEILTYKKKRVLSDIYNSRSWKLSKPIRILGKLKQKSSSTYNYPDNKGKSFSIAKDLEGKLWGGFSQYALEELNKVKTSYKELINERIKAATALSRWYFNNEAYHQAYEELQYIQSIIKLKKNQQNWLIREIKVLKKLNRTEEAKVKVWSYIKNSGLTSEISLAMAHLAEDDAERVNWLNMVYNKSNYLPIHYKNNQLDLENVYSVSNQRKISKDSGKVSVIMPAYNSEKLIHIALDSLLNQTYQNLEIIVVDDCSTDNTTHVVTQYAEKDKRVKLIKKSVNEGAYAARNTGLDYISGDFVTIHDSDDWSHPQKIEVQLSELINNRNCMATLSYLIRTTKDLVPLNAGSTLSNNFLTINSSSLLVRQQVFKDLGKWDNVRVAGDTEFIWRLEKYYGEDKIVKVEPYVPLSLSLSNERSLTGSSMTHISTIKFGLRRSYREACEWWHTQVEPENLYLDGKTRKFPSPVPNMVEGSRKNRTYDIILIDDFSTEESESNMSLISKSVENKNYKIAVFHWPNYEKEFDRKITNNNYRLFTKQNIDILVPNEEVEAQYLIYFTPKIYKYKLDYLPIIESENNFVFYDNNISEEDMELVNKNIYETMDKKTDWLEVGEAANRLQ